MSDSLSLEISAGLSWLFEETLDLSTLTDNARLEYSASLTDGSGPGQANRIWHATRSIASGGNDDHDLTALSQTLYGTTVTVGFNKIRALLIVNTSVNSGDTIFLDSSVANAFTSAFHGSTSSQLEIPPDSPLLLVNKVDGWTVTGGTADMLRISNSGSANFSYKIVIVGTSI